MPEFKQVGYDLVNFGPVSRRQLHAHWFSAQCSLTFMKVLELFILRHGIAIEKSRRRFPQDHERPLTPEGKQKIRAIARRLKLWRVRPDLILASPLLRAVQTAEIAGSFLALKKKPQMTEHLAPNGDMKAFMAQLARAKPRPKRVLLVGHEPYLSRLISI